MADKKLTISVESKVSPQVQQLSKLLDDLAARGNKFARAVQGVSGLSGEGATASKTGGLAKALLGEKKLFEDLGKSGEKLAKVLNEQVTKSQGTLSRQLEASTKQLDVLLKKQEFTAARLQRLKNEGADPARIALAERYAQRANVGVLGGVGDVMGLRDALGVEGAAGGAGGGTGLGQALLGYATSRVPGAGMLMGMGAAGAGMAAVAAGAVIGYKMSIAAGQAPISASAGLGGSLSASLGATGNATNLLGSGIMVQGDPKLQAGLTPRTAVVAVGSLIKNMATQGLFGWDPKGAIATTQKEIDAYYRNALLDRATEVGESGGAAGGMTQSILATAQQRISLARRFGRGTMESMGRMGAELGIDPGALTGYLGGLAPSVGSWSARRYLGQVAGAELGGMDPGTAVGIVGAGAVSGSNVLSRIRGMDPTMRGILGTAAVSNMGPTSMMFAGKGDALAEQLAGAVTETGGPMGVRQAQQAALGANLMGQVYAGHDPFQKSYNIAAASAALGAGGSSYSRNFLATQMSDPAVLAQVMSAKSDKELPAAFRNMGISLDQAKATARDIDRGLVASRWFDTGDTSPAARRMRELKSAGGPLGWMESMKGLSAREKEKRIEEVAPLFAQVEMGLTGGDVGAAESILRRQMGIVSPGGRRRAGAAAGPRAPDAEDVVLDLLKENLKKLSDTVTDLSGSAKNASGEFVKTADTLKTVRGQIAAGVQSAGVQGGKPVPKK